MRDGVTAQGIPTVYRGTRFRSRLEARWACFFDLIDWQWEYEPFDLEGYIPDFLILGHRPLVIEVKPWATIDELTGVAEKIPLVERDVLVVGCTIFPTESEDWGRWPAGAMREWDYHQGEMGVATGRWHTCGQCKSPAVHHEIQSFEGRPCGHYDGDHFLHPLNVREHERLWAIARNETQWKGA